MGATSGRPAPAAAPRADDASVRELVQMGFDAAQAREALQASGGDVAIAAEFLLTNAESQARTHVPARPSMADARRERALLAAQARAVASRAAAPNPSQAARRASAPGSARTPSREELIVRSVEKLALMPDSLDILITSVGKVLTNPSDPRYRRVPLGNANFKRHVVNAPGGLELLEAVGYERDGDALVLRSRDELVLALALSALEGARGSSVYLEARSEALLLRALDESRLDWDEAESSRRALAAARVPVEPADGAAGNTLLCFHLGAKRDRSRCVWRRFESWNTLADVVAFVEATTPFQVGRTAELFDVTLSSPAKLVDADAGRTLQGLGLWPSGHVRVQPLVAAA